jgi:hypothetical protein
LQHAHLEIEIVGLSAPLMLNQLCELNKAEQSILLNVFCCNWLGLYGISYIDKTYSQTTDSPTLSKQVRQAADSISQTFQHKHNLHMPPTHLFFNISVLTAPPIYYQLLNNRFMK